jgi:hypothetical protein
VKPIEPASPQNAPAYPGRRKARISGRFRPAVFILLSVIFLYLLTSLPLEMHSGIFHIKKIDLISALSRSMDASKRGQRANPSAQDAGSNQLRISAKSGAPSAGSEAPEESALEREDPLQPIELFSDDALDPFFRALRGLPRSSEPVRIAYYGDSIIEGDMLTRDLRLNLQAQFGGSGVGYLPITSEVSLFRNSIGHSFSPEWQSLSLLQADRLAPLGIAGMVFIPACQEDPEGGLFCTSWVEYRAVKSAEKPNRIQTVRLFYSHAPPSASVEYVADKAEPKTINLQPGPEIQETILSPDPPARKIRITFTARAGFNVYGASLEGEKGILLDNFAMRGNSGIPLIRIPNSQLSGFERLLRYRLIILHFGANVATPDPQDFSWYEIGLIKMIRHFQVSFPETAFLLVSCSDRSYKDGLDYVTIPAIPQLVETQRRAAQKTGVAFWNLYAAMGGENAMARWVDYHPSLAALDYTHFSLLGAKRIADDFYRALMDGYKRFEDKLGR